MVGRGRRRNRRRKRVRHHVWTGLKNRMQLHTVLSVIVKVKIRLPACLLAYREPCTALIVIIA